MSSLSSNLDHKTLSSTGEAGSEVLIRAQNVSKKFCRDFRKSLFYGLRDTAADLLKVGGRTEAKVGMPILRPGEFWANEDISFEVKRGECLGLIGHNGAGKTTLLKMLNGLMKPDFGTITMKGRVGALIALGAGFNPILTGRENVYVNGAILGLNKTQITAKLEEIVEFAELDEAIDAPVRTYSSGMQVRLGFAVAVILIQPDVLILDEVLAVGDMAFTIKCLNIVRRLTESSAVVFVSHNVQFVSQFCNDIMMLENGRVHTHTNNVSRGIEIYLSACEQTVEVSGTGEVIARNEILSTAAAGDLQDFPRRVTVDDSLRVKLTFDVAHSVALGEISLVLRDNSGRPVALFVPKDSSNKNALVTPGQNICEFELGCLGLTPGKYYFVVAVRGLNPERICLRKEGVLAFTVSDSGARGYTWAPLTRTASTKVQNLGESCANLERR